jgi:hypothetical protein
MSYLAPSTSSLQSLERINQGTIRSEPQLQRYASLVMLVFLRVNIDPTYPCNSPHTVSIHILDNDSLLNVFYLFRLGEGDNNNVLDDTDHITREAGDGAEDAGGINPRMFARDGETSYSGRHPTSIFPLSVQKERPLQTCWRIHHPFRLSSITLNIAAIATSLRKMNRGQSLL